MPLGSPAIPNVRADPRTGAVDVRSLQNALNAIGERLRQIETTLGGTVSADNVGLFSALSTQVDGLVVKANGVLVTRKLDVGEGLSVSNPTGAVGDPKIGAPVLADLTTESDGFVVRSGSGAVTRVFIDGSGSGIAITNPDGVGGDPAFSTAT